MQPRPVNILAVSALLPLFLLTSTAFFVNELVSIRQRMLDEIATVALIIANNSSGALSFMDKDSASQTLSAINVQKHITWAALFDSTGSLFVQYASDGNIQGRGQKNGGHGNGGMSRLNPEQKELIRQGEGYLFSKIGFCMVKPVIFQGENIGTVFIHADNTFFRSAIFNYLLISGMFFIITLVVCFLISSKLQKLFSEPVVALAKAMEDVSSEKDYSIRMASARKDELGILYQGFNEMLE